LKPQWTIQNNIICPANKPNEAFICTSMQTTNDMPIVYPSFKTLGILPLTSTHIF
jgi:hypothetical protein